MNNPDNRQKMWSMRLFVGDMAVLKKHFETIGCSLSAGIRMVLREYIKRVKVGE